MNLVLTIKDDEVTPADFCKAHLVQGVDVCEEPVNVIELNDCSGNQKIKTPCGSKRSVSITLVPISRAGDHFEPSCAHSELFW